MAVAPEIHGPYLYAFGVKPAGQPLIAEGMLRHAMYYLQNSPGLFQTGLYGNPAPYKKTPLPGRQPDRGIRWGIQFIHEQIVLPICHSFNCTGFYYRLGLY
jgi:hypothetical protein